MSQWERADVEGATGLVGQNKELEGEPKGSKGGWCLSAVISVKREAVEEALDFLCEYNRLKPRSAGFLAFPIVVILRFHSVLFVFMSSVNK